VNRDLELVNGFWLIHLRALALCIWTFVFMLRVSACLSCLITSQLLQARGENSHRPDQQREEFAARRPERLSPQVVGHGPPFRK
jgi:hypothetical protein